jgi:hypothetical protein
VVTSNLVGNTILGMAILFATTLLGIIILMIRFKIGDHILTDLEIPTMTTSVFTRSLDLNVDNSIYNLRGKAKCVLGAAAYNWRGWENKVETTEEALRLLSPELERAFPHFSHWLLLGHRSWLENTRIARHKKLWSSQALQGVKLPEGRRMSEFEVEEGGRVKYFSAIKCESICDKVIAPILRSRLEAKLIFSDVLEDNINFISLLSIGFCSIGVAPSDQILDFICYNNAFYYLPFGSFDDRESGCAVIAKGNLMSLCFPVP